MNNQTDLDKKLARELEAAKDKAHETLNQAESD